MTRFTTSAIDVRKLSMQFFQIAKQSAGRREFVHGKIHSMECDCSACKRAA